MNLICLDIFQGGCQRIADAALEKEVTCKTGERLQGLLAWECFACCTLGEQRFHGADGRLFSLARYLGLADFCRTNFEELTASDLATGSKGGAAAEDAAYQ